MSSWSAATTPPKKPNYKVRFRHGVFPDVESQATRADIKKYDYFFGDGQRWVGTPSKGMFVFLASHSIDMTHANTTIVVDFVDESTLVADDSEGSGSASSRRPTRHLTQSRISEITRGPERRRNAQSTERASQTSGSARNSQLFVPEAAQQDSPPSWQVPSHIRRHTSPDSSLDEPVSVDWPSHISSRQPEIALNSSTQATWPISDPIEAHLFRFWVDKVSESLDLTSPQSVFKEVIPKLALKNTMLMNAIFMTSAQHVLRFDPFFPTRPYMYHDRILQSLIPYLAEKGRIEDEGTLVAAILLRAFEEFHAGTRGQTVLSTFELFYGPEGWLLDMSSPVVQSCLLVHVHAEVGEALLNPGKLRIDYESFILPALVSPLDDISWGNRILWLSARVLQWVERGSHAPDEWWYLCSLVDEWEEKRPISFDAFFYQMEDPETVGYFPELWFSSAGHADANQHLRICRIALAANRPDGEVQGLHRDMSDEVLKGLKETVAIARCDTRGISAPWKAAHTVHKFAELLRDDADRIKMINFLEEVNAMGMPTSATIEHLKEQWGWGWNHYPRAISPSA
ncbi:Arca [Pyrenophora seminiperda CCB06]|uniref:Arca n=1 Tax=Pyrenophora seminiperda CCB06 TaxID=1302712 RepID=A0A3M7M4Y5_9PLEO|nr:Arca [Pyrenophora seminiperda CCB06]